MHFLLEYIFVPTILSVSIYYLINNVLLYRNNKPIIISIDGNIGSGKSTLIEKMKEKFSENKNIIFLQEPVNNWISLTDKDDDNILSKFYKDKNRWAYVFQNFAFITRARIMLDAIKKNTYNMFEDPKIIITERSVETDKNVFAKMLYKDNNMTDLEFKIYNEWYTYMYPEIKVNNIVYLRTLPEVAYDRMCGRSRDEEKSVPKDYIQMVHNYHDHWLTNNTDCYNICCLDGNKNIEQKEKTFEDHISKIMVFINTLK